MSAILRQSYLKKIERYLGKDTIIILTGQRRIGKSCILRLFRDKVNKDERANIIFIADEATREREFGNLRAIKDNYPKYVISMTPLVGKQDSDGITHLHLRRFLSEGLE